MDIALIRLFSSIKLFVMDVWRIDALVDHLETIIIKLEELILSRKDKVFYLHLHKMVISL